MTDAAAPQYLALADLIERDIRARKLRSGDRYPATAEVAKKLGAGTGAVNRALQLLVRRRVLRRKQRIGTVVDLAPTEAPALSSIHIVVARDAVEAEGLFRDGTLLGLQEAVPSAKLHFDFTPPLEDPGLAARFIDDLLKGTERDAGFVLVRSSLALQRAVEASGLPCVLSGSRFPSVTGLPYVNRDNRMIARLLAKHLLRRRRRKLLVLLRSQHSPGDDHLLDALRDQLDRAGLGAGSLVTRSLPTDAAAVRHEVRSLLSAPKPPTAILCRNVPMSEAADAGARAAGRSVPIAVCDYFPHAGGPAPRFPYTRPVDGPEETGRRLGRALLGMAAGKNPDDLSLDTPMELVQGVPR